MLTAIRAFKNCQFISETGKEVTWISVAYLKLRKKNKFFAEYCRKNFPKKFKFKSCNKVYEAEKFYINVNGIVKIVFALKKDGVILNIISLYECEHPELFGNDYLNLRIDEVIKEDN